jgi:hypothetical protein
MLARRQHKTSRVKAAFHGAFTLLRRIEKLK